MPVSVALQAQMTLSSRYAERPELTDLNAGIESVWSSLSDRSGEYRVLPDGRCDIILRFQGGERPIREVTAVVTGPATGYYDVPIVSGMGFAGVRLRPGSFFKILGLEPASLRDRNLVGDAALGACPELAAICLPAVCREELLNRLIGFVHRRNAQSNYRLPPRTREVLGAFHASSGRLRIGEIARMHDIADRTVRRIMIEATGLPPKAFAQILQFHRALRLLRDHHLSPADAALEAGFSDQPHMNRVFRRLGGISPTRLPDLTLVTIRD
ncbi:helix-turn-helix domain-containing protein [Pararhizobium sp. DWP1-1-3]|uniref:helix-turn-helix domain-containing protein n=1 Tax=Pararhizobium sp. DWP1-1-3 TaxID=2804652 RepID=UPI003CF6B49C